MNLEVDWSEFSALTMAHELKAPLSLIRQLSLNLKLAEDEQEVEEIKDQIIHISEYSITQIEDLLKALRSKNSLFKLEPVNPRALCNDVVKNLPDKHAIRISYRNQSKLVLANHQLLSSVIRNFCLNAINYSYAAKCNLSIYDIKKDHRVRIVIRDYGPAIPTPLWRVLRRNQLKSPQQINLRPNSSAIGLFIAARFTAQMQGNFGLIRHRNGTSFYVDFPTTKQMSLL